MAEDGKCAQAPAVGVSITFDLMNGRQMVIQTHFDQGLSPEDSNRLLDRLVGMADRQRARYEIDALEMEQARNLKTRESCLADLARLDAEYEFMLDEFDKKIAAVEEKECGLKMADRRAWEAKGKQGDWAASSHLLNQLKACTAEKTEIVKAREEAKAVHERDIRNTQATLAEWKFVIEKCDKTIKDKVALRETVG